MDEQDDRWIAATASALLAAEYECVPIDALTVRPAGLTVETAYRVQKEAVARRIVGGARVVGHKAGVTSQAMQEQMGVYEPDSGVLLDDRVLPTGNTLARCVLMQPRVEAEIAFRLGCDVAGPNVGVDEARAATKEVFLALEVIDTRFTSWRITVADSIADNASCAWVVTGPMVPLSADLDLAAEHLVVSVDGTAVATGEGRAVLGDPLRALIWLAGRLDRSGDALRAGQLVLAGAVHASLPLEARSTVRAHSPHLPPVELHVR
ncbi:2-keto-4-pentenoate hydratase [Streptomyces radicis]|uniref:2-hydroxypenta-2,4-dienoate hydratase n=1 Tax=Streptomyces radicis TaxID=1750517 RepID=A0A3A9W253_9ACTN|nr:fumarylacetoacetate hydrolase family protein [Streptomyces radicis]RKN06523.1 2-hydroxypenta-2,4-dienoate hydratase [Streptomyces radicis]RKN20218.1 2-hydroxypenta-2,4-dienoate hydratase [Streptomyces radicis]